MKLEELKQLIKECILEESRRTNIQSVEWDVDSMGKDSALDGYYGDNTDTYKDDFTVDDLVEILDRLGVVQDGTIKLPYDVIQDGIYTESGLYKLNIDFIDSYIKTDKKLLGELIHFIERETSQKILNSYAAIEAIKKFILEEGGSYMIEYLEIYTELYDKYCKSLYDGLYNTKYELDNKKIISLYFDEYINNYDYNVDWLYTKARDCKYFCENGKVDQT